MHARFQTTRPAAVAGRFYPRSAAELGEIVAALMLGVAKPSGRSPKALIAPHAGYVYSGPIAASAYAQFAADRDLIKRVVLFGPAHYVAFDGLALPAARAFETPLGLVHVDEEAMGQLRSLPYVQVLEEAHAPEHSLEVQLPFLQRVLGEFKVVPVLAGNASAEQVSQAINLLWDGPQTRFVISSDLSHYHDSQTARRLDRAAAQAIEDLAPEKIGEDQACGRIPIRGLLRCARDHKLRARTLDLRNSGDTAGPKDQVVGYGAFAFEEAD